MRARSDQPERTAQTRRGRQIALWGFAAFVGAWAIACVSLAWLAWRDVRAGSRVLQDARADIGLDDLTSTKPAARLGQAFRHFEDARARLSSPVLAPVRMLPVAGRHLDSVHSLARSAAHLTGTGAAIATDVRRAVLALPASGGDRVSALGDLEAAFTRALSAVDEVDLGPSRALVARVAGERDRMAEEVAETRASLDDGLALTRAALDLLEGPRRYLVVAANNAEMRSGSGMFLQLGSLQTGGGSFSLTSMRPAHELTLPAPVPVTGDLEERWGFTELGREWRNLASSPRFPASAELAARMWEQAVGESVDGVIAVDVRAVALLIGATDGVEVGGRALDGASAEQFLLHDQYLTIEDGGTAERDSQRERRDSLGELAETLVEEMASGRVDTGELISAVRTAVRGRHVLVWSREEVLQQAWESANVSGTLTPRSMLLSVMNRGGNKLDPHLQVDATVERVGETVTVDVEIDNRTPADEIPYVAGPHPDIEAEPGAYVGFVALNAPAAASVIDIEGGPIVTAGPDGPTRMAATQIVLPRGETARVTFRFGLPRMNVRFEPSARIPPVRWRHGDVTFRDRRPRTFGV